MTLGRTLVLHRRPGKSYVHAADLFDALTGGFGGWRRAHLRCHARLESGALVVPAGEAPIGNMPMARFRVEGTSRPMEFRLLPLAHLPAPAASEPIPEQTLLADGWLNHQTLSYPYRPRSHPFGLLVVTAALEVLWELFPQDEWLLAEMDLPNPEGWPPESPLGVRLDQRLGRRFAFFQVELGRRSVGSLRFARYVNLSQV